MAKGLIEDSILLSIANAIRNKKGSSAGIKPINFATEINSIPTSAGALVATGSASKNTTSLSASGIYITVPEDGTYDAYWSGARSYNSGTFQSQLYVNNRAYGTAKGSFTQTYFQYNTESGMSLHANDRVEIYARSSGSTRYMMVANLILVKR